MLCLSWSLLGERPRLRMTFNCIGTCPFCFQRGGSAFREIHFETSFGMFDAIQELATYDHILS